MIDPLATRQRLDTIADEVQRGDRAMAERLRALADAVSGAPTANEWVDIDLFRAFDAEALADEIQPEPATALWVGRLETLRNVLILAPVLVTWFGMSAAVKAFHALVERDMATGSNRTTLPFLYLWENRFDGLLDSWLTLSRVALYDSILILSVLVLTGVTFVATDIIERRRRDAATALRRRLHLTLADATFCLARLVGRRPETFASQFAELAKRLLDEIQADRERMEQQAKSRDQELINLRTFSANLVQGSNSLLQSAQSLTTLHAKTNTAIGSLASAVVKLDGGQEKLLSVGASVGGRLEHLTTAQQGAGRELKAALDSLNGMVTRMSEASARIATVAEAQGGLAERLGANALRVASATERLEQANQGIVKTAGELAIATAAQTAGQVKLTQVMDMAGRQSADAVTEQRRLVQLAGNAGTQLAAFVTEQQPLARGLTAALAEQTRINNQLAPAVTAVSEIADRLGNAETTLLDSMQQEHDALGHVALVVSQASMALEATLKRITDQEHNIFGLTADLQTLNTSLPAFASTLDTSLRDLVETYKHAAERMEQAGDAVLLSAGVAAP